MPRMSPMLKLYYHPSPNPLKVALFLEEAGLPYEVIPVDTRKGEQHLPSFRAINPNGKTPALVDGDVSVFDSNAILLYLAEKTGQFLPANTPAARAQMHLVADVRRHRHRPLLRAGRALQVLRARAQGIRRQPLHFEASGTGASSTSTWPASNGWWATPTRWWTWRCGAGRGDPPRDGRSGAWRPCPTSTPTRRINARPAAQRAEALKERFTFKQEIDDEAKRALVPAERRSVAG